MSEIPEDIRATARGIIDGIDWLEGGPAIDGLDASIAEALMAERARCAKIADRETNGPMYEGDQMWRAGYEEAARVIAESICSPDTAGTP